MNTYKHSVILVPFRSRSPPEGKSVSPPQSATLLASLSATSHTFVIPKETGLGIIIGGGINRQDGPHVFIDKIMDGMDAAKVSPVAT